MKKMPNPMTELTEQELATLLLNVDIPTPYDDLIPKFSPWHHSMKLLVWGMILNSIKLEFWNLHYILPALGAILIPLALLPLRRENGWFRLSWWGSVGNLLHTGMMLFLWGTIWHNHLTDTTFGTLLQWSSWFFFFSIYFAPLLGLAQLSRKAGCPPPNKRLVGFMLLSMSSYFYMGLAATLPRFLPLLAFAVYFSLLIWLLRQAFREMDQVGYLIQSRPARLSALPLGVLLAGFLIGCTAVGMTAGQSYPMNWRPVNLQQEHRGQEDLMAELISKGMPEDILMDLTAEDVATLTDVKQIVVEQEPLVVIQDMWLIPPSQTLKEEPDLVLTTVIVSFHDDSRHLRLIHHFHWVKDVPLGSTASIHVPLSGTSSPTGQLLYRQGNRTVSAPYHNITVSSLHLLWSDTEERWSTAVFSIPKGYSDLRGYLMLESSIFSNSISFITNCHYFFRNTWRVYPAPDVTKALENIHSIANPTKGFYHIPKYHTGNLTP